MTTNEPTNRELADLFAADKRWRWLYGMDVRGEAIDGPAIILSVREATEEEKANGQTDAIYVHDGTGPGAAWLGLANPTYLRPNLEHGGTLGLIEHVIVPEALEDPDACLCFSPLDRSWYVYSPKHDDCATSKATKPAALLAALAEADDIVRRSTAGRVQVEDFGDPDDLVDDGFEDRDLSDYERDGYDRVPTDPKLCTRPPPAVAVTARAFLNSLQQRDADIEAKRRAKLRDKEPTQ